MKSGMPKRAIVYWHKRLAAHGYASAICRVDENPHFVRAGHRGGYYLDVLNRRNEHEQLFTTDDMHRYLAARQPRP